jgi:hypothetical protein
VLNYIAKSLEKRNATNNRVFKTLNSIEIKPRFCFLLHAEKSAIELVSSYISSLVGLNTNLEPRKKKKYDVKKGTTNGAFPNI